MLTTVNAVYFQAVIGLEAMYYLDFHLNEFGVPLQDGVNFTMIDHLVLALRSQLNIIQIVDSGCSGVDCVAVVTAAV